MREFAAAGALSVPLLDDSSAESPGAGVVANVACGMVQGALGGRS